MIHADAIRRAFVTRLRTDALLTSRSFSSPPANFKLGDGGIVVIGEIAAEPSTTKGGTSFWYNVGVECWAQTTSPLDLDRLSKAAMPALNGAVLVDVDAVLSPPQFAGSADAFNPDAPGGPVLSRTLTFRLLAQNP